MKGTELHSFLLIYNRRRGVLESHEDFDIDSEEALEAYARAEALHRGDPDYDVVLVGSDSLDTVRKTHSTYFAEGVPNALDYLRDSLAQVGLTPELTPL